MSLQQLEESFQLLLSKLTESDMFPCGDVKEIDFLYDFYWSVPIGKRDDISNKIENDIGSIDHDIERLIKGLLEKDINSHHFRYFGNVLIAIADILESRGIFI